MVVNGKKINLDQEVSLEQFLSQEGYHLSKVAIELNERIIPKSEYAAVHLTDYDRLEIIHFVGGG